MTNHYRSAALLLAYLDQSNREVHCGTCFLHGQSSRWQHFLDGVCEELEKYDLFPPDTVLVPGVQGGQHGYAGSEAWCEHLQEFTSWDCYSALAGVVDDSFPLGDSRHFNTLTESVGLVRWLQEKQITQVRLFAPHFHLLRVAISFATASHLFNARIRPTFTPVVVGAWNEQIVHSQGRQSGTIAEITAAELEKVAGANRYDNLLTPDEALAFLGSLET